MQVKNKLYPYPVLNQNPINSTFFNRNFKLCFKREDTKGCVLLRDIHFETNSNYITKLYEEGAIDVVCIVECSHSVFRKNYPITNKLGKTLPLNTNDFNGKVEISLFAYAKKDFSISSEEFLDDYKGVSFPIDKYDILAVDDGIVAKFDHMESEENMVKSIFSITIDEALSADDAYSTFYEGKKISIYLSRTQYENYNIVYNSPNFKEVFFNMLLVPVLTEAFTTIKRLLEDDSTIDDICDKYTWFASVKKGYQKIHANELTKDLFLEDSPVSLAQKLLGKPLGPSLVNIIEVIRGNKEEGEDE